MSENRFEDGVMILEDSEFGGFELQPMDKEAFFKTIKGIEENKDGIPVVIEGVKPVTEKEYKGKKKHGFSLKLVPQEPIEKALIKEIVERKVKDKKTGEMVERKVYDDKDEFGDPKPLTPFKNYEHPVHMSFTFNKVKEIKVESSEEYPEGIMNAYVVNPLSSAFPLLNFLLENSDERYKGNTKGFAINQEKLNELEGLEFVANCELVNIEGLKPFMRLTASEIDFDFSDNSEDKN